MMLCALNALSQPRPHWQPIYTSPPTTKSGAEQFLEDYGKIKNEVKTLKDRVNELETENARLRDENAELKVENTQLKVENTQLRADNTQLKAESSKLIKEKDALTTEFEKSKRELDEKNKKLEIQKKEYEEKSRELEELRVQMDNYIDSLEQIRYSLKESRANQKKLDQLQEQIDEAKETDALLAKEHANTFISYKKKWKSKYRTYNLMNVTLTHSPSSFKKNQITIEQSYYLKQGGLSPESITLKFRVIDEGNTLPVQEFDLQLDYQHNHQPMEAKGYVLYYGTEVLEVDSDTTREAIRVVSDKKYIIEILNPYSNEKIYRGRVRFSN